VAALIKKRRKSLVYKEISDGSGCKVIYEGGRTDKKLNKIFLVYKEISDGSSCKVIYEGGRTDKKLNKIFLVYKEISDGRNIYEEEELRNI
jgi:hypothetical protein